MILSFISLTAPLVTPRSSRRVTRIGRLQRAHEFYNTEYSITKLLLNGAAMINAQGHRQYNRRLELNHHMMAYPYKNTYFYMYNSLF